MDIRELREKIDIIDNELTELFLKRMEVSAEIAEYKKANGLSVRDAERELQKLRDIASTVPEDMRRYISALYELIFSLSRDYQERMI